MNEIKEIIEEIKIKKLSNLEILQLIQEKYNYISIDILRKICKELEIPKSKIFGILTFYSQFSTQERGKYLIRVCDGTACHVKGGNRIIDMLKRDFKLEDGKTTEDKKFTLQIVACLGSCFIAPVCMVNSIYYGNMDENKFKKVLENLK
ncbi:MAG: NAD(P)H-dependent oxidoreductase subunit E [bacterium]|nr:NAD(P)H-dependent oxidoreductase subunit E [bacterium]MCX7917516.1 NAD(P)H-dependent oxidoreductase subunit E [bacterium]MDW8163602.1 NAD(P)H-dependent oxidoreductase subunit E [Candidatus Omnitrophota bacterium]